MGGTGLYLRAAISDLIAAASRRPERWERLYDRLGPERAHALLAVRDPLAAQRIHPNDRRRVVRALELAEIGIAAAQPGHAMERRDCGTRRSSSASRCHARSSSGGSSTRTQAMFDAGVEDEVRRALAGGVSHTARHALGLDEIARLPQDEAIAAVVLRTRRYAAYQRKWMRKMPDLIRVEAARPAGRGRG